MKHTLQHEDKEEGIVSETATIILKNGRMSLMPMLGISESIT